MKTKALRYLAWTVLTVLLLTGCLSRGSSETNRRQLPQVPENRTRAEAFSTAQDGSVTYPGALQGIDVSSHQGEIDWQRVKAAGIDFAILQIGYRGYSAGKLNKDSRFETNLAEARAAGVRVGVYFYSQACSEEEALEEADFVLQELDGRSLDLPVFYDWEEVTDGRTVGMATSAVGDYALAFCRRITAGGEKAGVYFNQKYGYDIMHLEALTDYMFWLAEYRSYQSFDSAVAIWQYTGQGHVDGIDIQVDRDLMYGPEEE